jgi:hypothetical protein
VYEPVALANTHKKEVIMVQSSPSNVAPAQPELCLSESNAHDAQSTLESWQEVALTGLVTAIVGALIRVALRDGGARGH